MISSTVHMEEEEEEEREEEEEEREEEGDEEDEGEEERIVGGESKQTMLSAVIDGLSVTKDVWGCGYAPTSENSETGKINRVAYKCEDIKSRVLCTFA